MPSRREIVQGGVALAALTLGSLRAPLARAGADARRASAPRSVDLVIVDRAFPEAGRFALEAAELGYRVRTFEHDVAPIWMNALEPALRAGRLAVAGLTAPGTAFCLEILSTPYGAASFARDEHAAGADARVAPLLRAAASADSTLAPYAHVARPAGDAPAFLTWLIATRG
jgi:hypothetical protein